MLTEGSVKIASPGKTRMLVIVIRYQPPGAVIIVIIHLPLGAVNIVTGYLLLGSVFCIPLNRVRSRSGGLGDGTHTHIKDYLSETTWVQ